MQHGLHGSSATNSTVEIKTKYPNQVRDILISRVKMKIFERE